MEASLRVGHHAALRVSLSSCVATLYPDIESQPRYTFLQDGCLLDSELPGSRSHFLSRSDDSKLQLVIDAFRFHNENEGRLYITCHLFAVSLNDAETPHEACSLINGRWRSADGNDFLCGRCQSPSQGQVSSGTFSPRGFGKKNEVREQEARLGPMLVLPSRRKSPVPEAEVPAVLGRISRPSLYGSFWKSGLTLRPDEEEEQLPEASPEKEEDDKAAEAPQGVPAADPELVEAAALNTTEVPAVMNTTVNPFNSTAAPPDL